MVKLNNEIEEEVFEEGFVDEILISRIPGEYKCDTYIDYNLIEKKYHMKELLRVGKSQLEVEHWVKNE